MKSSVISNLAYVLYRMFHVARMDVINVIHKVRLLTFDNFYTLRPLFAFFIMLTIDIPTAGVTQAVRKK